MTQTFTVDTRGLFTVHKGGCAHLNFTRSGDARFDIETEPTVEAIYAALEEYDQGNGVEEVVTLGPCLAGLE